MSTCHLPCLFIDPVLFLGISNYQSKIMEMKHQESLRFFLYITTKTNQVKSLLQRKTLAITRENNWQLVFNSIQLVGKLNNLCKVILPTKCSSQKSSSSQIAALVLVSWKPQTTHHHYHNQRTSIKVLCTTDHFNFVANDQWSSHDPNPVLVSFYLHSIT